MISLSKRKREQFNVNYSRLNSSHISKMVKKNTGLGIATAAIFIAGETAGSGVLALPHTMIDLSWWGLVLLVIFAINCTFNGLQLGSCFKMIEESFYDLKEKEEEKDEEFRDPYPCIGEKAGNTIHPLLGSFLRHLTFICIALVSYGSACVFLILIAGFSYDIFSTIPTVTISFCSWMYIITGLLIPLCWLGTPKDFWPVAVSALAGTIIACLLIIFQLIMDRNNSEYTPSKCYNATMSSIFTPNYPTPTIYDFCSSFGRVMYAYAGASVFPTIQADMADKSKFHISVILAMTIVCVIYLPVAFVGYYILGDCVEENVVQSLSKGPITIVIQVMMIIHLISAYPIVMNPPNQYLEELLSIPSNFNGKRIVFRTLSVLSCSFICISIPRFSSILDVVGSGPATFLNIVFPTCFYLLLRKSISHKKLTTKDIIFSTYILVLGSFGGIFGTFNAFKNMFSTQFVPPCYIDSSITP